MAEDRTRIVQAIIRAKNESAAVLGQFKSSLLGLSVAGVSVAGAMYALQKAIGVAVKAASEQETADIKLAAALRTLGQNTSEVRNELIQFASDLQGRLGIADEEIQAVIATLTQFGRLSGENLKRATQATLDYAAATGNDAKGAAIALSKALEGGSARLAGIAIKFDEGATKGERFDQLMGAIEKTTGGTAAALGNTFAGALNKVDLAFSDLQEAIGNVLVKNQAVRQIFEEFIGLLQQLTTTVTGSSGALSAWVSRLIGGTARMAEAAVSLVEILDKTNLLIAAWHLATGSSLVFKDALEAVMGQSQDLKSVTDALHAALQRIQEAAKETASATDVVADSLGEGDKGLAGSADKAKTALEELGIKTFPELQKQAGFVQQAFNEMQRALGEGQISPEFFAQVAKELEAMAKALEEAGITVAIPLEGAQVTFIAMEDALRLFVEEGVGGLQEAIAETNLQIETLGQTLTNTLRGAGVAGAVAVGDALVDAAFGADINFKKFFKALLADLAKAIVRAIILQAILGVATSGGSTAGTIGISIGGGQTIYQQGGEVRGGIAGLDSVRALLTPGEIVLPTSRRDDFDAIAFLGKQIREGAGAPTGSQGLPVFQAQFNIAPRRDDREAADLIEDINRLVERRGYRLTATHLTG